MHWPALVRSLQDPLRFKPVGGDAFEGTGKTDKAKAALTLLQKHDEKELKKARAVRTALRRFSAESSGRDGTGRLLRFSHSPKGWAEIPLPLRHFGTMLRSVVLQVELHSVTTAKTGNKSILKFSRVLPSQHRGVAWRGVAWRGVVWRGHTCTVTASAGWRRTGRLTAQPLTVCQGGRGRPD